MKNYPEASKVWDVCELIVLGSICVAGAAVSIYFAAYFIVNIFWG